MENTFISWLKKNYVFLIAILCSLLVFVSVFTPIISTKGAVATFINDPDYPYYAYSKAHSREVLSFFESIKEGTALPFIVLFSLVGVGICFSFLGNFIHKNFYVASALLFLCLGVFFLVSNKFYDVALTKSLLKSNFNGDYGWSWEDLALVSETKLDFGATWSAIFCFASGLSIFSVASDKDSISVKDMAEISILSALGIGLQFIKIQIGATGGSINFGLIPLFIIALRKGPTKGFIASAFVFGLITCITDNYGFATYPFDYLIGFGGCAALGFFKNMCFSDEGKGYKPMGFLYILIGVVLASLIRLIGSSASSMINYGYTLSAALGYNYLYVLVTGGISLIAMEALFIPLARINKLFPSK